MASGVLGGTSRRAVTGVVLALAVPPELAAPNAANGCPPANEPPGVVGVVG